MNIVRILVFIFLAILSYPAFTQGTKQLDLIQLKNGSRISGTITERQIEAYVKIMTEDGHELVISMDDIEKIEKLDIKPNVQLGKPGRKKDIKKRGFESLLGFSASITPLYYLYHNEDQTFSVGFNWVNGYRFAGKYFVGLGVSYERYENKVVTLPVYLDFQMTFLNFFVSPLVSFSSGYALGWNDDLDGNDNGGVMLMPSIGAKFSFSRHAGLIVRFGYKMQQMKVFDFNRYLYLTRVPVSKTKLYHMLAVKIEFVF